ncbi:hypothetical protein D3C81_2324020 [compost metagenome]
MQFHTVGSDLVAIKDVSKTRWQLWYAMHGAEAAQRFEVFLLQHPKAHLIDQLTRP